MKMGAWRAWAWRETNISQIHAIPLTSRRSASYSGWIAETFSARGNVGRNTEVGYYSPFKWPDSRTQDM